MGSQNGNSRPVLADSPSRICAFFNDFIVSLTATICSGFKISRKCYFFSHVFKGLTSEHFVTHCFYTLKPFGLNSDKPLTVDRYGHNLVCVRTQHLVSNHEGKRGHFWHSPRKKHARWAGRCFSWKSAKNKSGLHKMEIYGVSTTEKKGSS